MAKRVVPAFNKVGLPRVFTDATVRFFWEHFYQTQDEMVWTVKKHIHFNNTKRIHSTIGAVSPNRDEQVFLKQA